MFLQLLSEGLVVTIVGVSVVLGFLTTLIFAMIIMSSIVGFLNKIFPEKLPELPVKRSAVKVSNDDEIAVAILGAFLKK